jgi:hypothetical protein
MAELLAADYLAAADLAAEVLGKGSEAVDLAVAVAGLAVVAATFADLILDSHMDQFSGWAATRH